jgi:hypothetical protein
VHTFIAIPLTCWVCTLVAAPRRPLPGNEVEELVYARLLGRQQRLLLLTLVITGIALVSALATVPQHIDPDLHALRDARGTCTYPSSGGPICPVLQPGGAWTQTQEQPDGSWRDVPTVTGPVFVTNPYDDPATHMR